MHVSINQKILKLNASQVSATDACVGHRDGKMTWKKTKAEFDSFADMYARFIAGDESRAPLNPGCRAAIDRLKPQTVLDCACGQGRSAIALKEEGISVHGSDISTEMNRLAEAMLARLGSASHSPFPLGTNFHSRLRGSSIS